MNKRSHLSTEYVIVNVTSETVADLSSTTVQVAVIAYGTTPASGDWVTGEWLDGDDAALLVGPDGDLELDAGVYSVWAKVVDSPEVPVQRADEPVWVY